jgi:anti-sigma factor RsiW
LKVSDELADIAKLADGTLDPARRDEVRARIEGSPALSAAYEREQRMVALLGEARATDRAPAGLRAHIEAQRQSRPRARAQRRRFAYAGALSGALAALILALVLLLPGGTAGAPTLAQAAALSARGPAAGPPAPDPEQPRVQLNRNIEHVYFPNWAERLGWRAVGQRSDEVNGRHAVTVYYAWRGQRIAYTIVGAPALAQPSAPVTELGGVQLRTLTLDHRLVVTWRRAGHTCVLSATTVPAAELQKLAAWHE